jgi:hypothetical protein
MKVPTKVIFFILFVVNFLVCYCVIIQINTKIDKIVLMHDSVPVQLSEKLNNIDRRVRYLENSEGALTDLYSSADMRLDR